MIKQQIGIYEIKNCVNGMRYIGQSIHIDARIKQHFYSAFQQHSTEYNTNLSKAIREYSQKNFTSRVVELCDIDKLDQKEVEWIAKFDTYHNGYNMTPGGENRRGDANGNAKLTEADVFEIRSLYDSHVPFRQAYSYYENRISKSGFGKVWHFTTWRHILPEVYNKENLEWHKKYSGKLGSDLSRKHDIADDEIKNGTS